MEPLGGVGPLLDEQLDALAHVERRRLLVALLRENPLPDAPDKLDESEGAAESHERRITAYHNHLPRLADHGFVRWDREDSLVSKGPQFEKIEPWVALLEENRDSL